MYPAPVPPDAPEVLVIAGGIPPGHTVVLEVAMTPGLIAAIVMVEVVVDWHPNTSSPVTETLTVFVPVITLLTGFCVETNDQSYVPLDPAPEAVNCTLAPDGIFPLGILEILIVGKAFSSLYTDPV